MRAAIINPYLDSLGGGERYSMAVATALSDAGVDVDVQWFDPGIKNQLEKRFGINLKNVNIIDDVKKGDGYDYCFWISDGSIPLMRARNNFLHFQHPFKDVNGNTLMNKMKLYRVKKIICNSQFTKKVIDNEYGVESVIVYPPVDVKAIKPKRKENIILYVGRFSQLEQAKNQDILIKAFKKLLKKDIDGWELVLAGGAEVGADSYVQELRNSAVDLPIRIMESPAFSQIKELYGKSRIFWSASGYGVDEKNDPKKVEHFGITVVEAMSAKCVPVIYKAGGHKEIIKDNSNGYLYKSLDELVNITKGLIGDSKKLNKTANNAHESCEKYRYERFQQEMLREFSIN